jgi:hypothetical protein
MKLNKNNNGFLEIELFDQKSGFEDFYRVAEKMKQMLPVNFTDFVDDFDSLYWKFFYKNSEYCLCYNTFIGITIYPGKGINSSTEENSAITELFNYMQSISEVHNTNWLE